MQNHHGKLSSGPTGRVVSSLAVAMIRDRRGLSGIEFALVLPIIVVLFAGTIDLGQGLMVSRKIDQVASVVSDIVARKSSWTAAQLDSLLAGSANIVEPFSSDSLKVQIAVIDINGSGKDSVNWSHGYGMTAVAAGQKSPITIPAKIAESGVQMIVSQVTYSMETPFTSLLSSFTGVSRYTFDRHSFARPRVKDTVTKN